MASSSRQTFYTAEEAVEIIFGDAELDEDTLGMGEDEEYDLDRQLGLYSDESR